MEAIVRIQQIELRDFKNVAHGIVLFKNAFEKNIFSREADIVGIYGQNGSGKTSAIDAIQVMEALLSGESMPAHTEDMIASGCEETRICCIFSIQYEEWRQIVSYEFVIRKEKAGAFIEEEQLYFMPFNEDTGEWGKKGKEIWTFKCNGHEALSEASIERNTLKDIVEKNVIQELARAQHTSFIFCKRGMLFVNRQFKKQGTEYRRILIQLKRFAERNLSVINNVYSGYINARMVQPFAFKLVDRNVMSKGHIGIPLDEPSTIPSEVHHLTEQLIQQMNHILPQIVPECTLVLKTYGEQMRDDGTKGYRIELLARRGKQEFPIRCESDGIKKIISVLNALIQVYNDETACVVIDEFDAGIFEYLLGDMVHALSLGARGQFIFTSHNSRPLEMLKETEVVFTTANPSNRYVRLNNEGNNNNLRSNFYRSIQLGGQEEQLYKAVNVYKLQRALRRANRYEEK